MKNDELDPYQKAYKDLASGKKELSEALALAEETKNVWETFWKTTFSVLDVTFNESLQWRINEAKKALERNPKDLAAQAMLEVCEFMYNNFKSEENGKI